MKARIRILKLMLFWIAISWRTDNWDDAVYITCSMPYCDRKLQGRQENNEMFVFWGEGFSRRWASWMVIMGWNSLNLSQKQCSKLIFVRKHTLLVSSESMFRKMRCDRFRVWGNGLCDKYFIFFHWTIPKWQTGWQFINTRPREMVVIW